MLLDCEPSAYQARVRPQAIACIDAQTGERLTYRQLDQRVGNCSGWLKQSLGAPEGCRIATLARNSLDQVVLFLACQRVGAIFTPLNWRLASAEIALLIADAEPRLLAYDAEFEAVALASAADYPPVDLVAMEAVHGWRTQAQAYTAEPSPQAPCVLLYTSGTTGRPKGVVITASNAFYASLNMAMVGEIGSASVLLCDVPLFHTVGLFAVTRTTLMAGGTLVMSDRFVPAQTLRRLSDPDLAVTHYFSVPQILAAMLDAPEFAQVDLSRLKAIFTGGAPLPAPLIDAFRPHGITLVNGYGMSEAGTTAHMPLAPELTRQDPGAIGFAAPLMALRIVDSQGLDVADGEAGEIWINGPSVSPGYWNQPQATAAVFQDGWFKTGDIALYEPSGVLRLLDRKKDMYISGGENVYPAEVEAALLAHPDVHDVAVVGAPHPRWGECGVAFVVARSQARLEAEALLAHCQGRLARFKHPSRIVFLDQIARTASGKIQKDPLRRRAAELSIPA